MDDLLEASENGLGATRLDPFYGIPLSFRQYQVFFIFFARQVWAISIMHWFAIYAAKDEKSLGFSMIFLGWLLISQFMGRIADTHGRLAIYRCAMFVQFVCALILAAAPYRKLLFMAVCFVLGSFFGVCGQLMSVIWNEALPARLLNVTTNVQVSGCMTKAHKRDLVHESTDSVHRTLGITTCVRKDIGFAIRCR
jgi:MFS family permease